MGKSIFDLIPEHQRAGLRQFLNEAREEDLKPKPVAVDETAAACMSLGDAIERLRAFDPTATAVVEGQFKLALEFIRAQQARLDGRRMAA